MLRILLHQQPFAKGNLLVTKLRMRLTLLGLLVFLAACSDLPNQPLGPAACTIERVAKVPIRTVRNAILVAGHVNGIPVQMQLDTGASASILDAAVAARLALPADPHARTTLRGIGGDIVTQNARINAFEIAGQEWQAMSIATGHLARRFQEDPPVVGLLGADRLSDFDVELDIPDGKMTLWNVSNCQGDFVRWNRPHYRIPLTRHSPNLMVARVDLDGHPVTALIDWGATTTTVTRPVALDIGVTAEMLAKDRAGTTRGVDLVENEVRLHKFAEMRIGGEKFRDVGVAVSDLHLPNVSMLLGVDFWRSRRVWLSYATRQLFVAPRVVTIP